MNDTTVSAKTERKTQRRYVFPLYILMWGLWMLLITHGTPPDKTDVITLVGSFIGVSVAGAIAAVPCTWAVQWLIHEIIEEVVYRLKQSKD
jgi:hypothetical protein